MARRHLLESRAIVTGASSGIGRQLVWQLAAAGGLVVAVARREELLRQLSDEVAAARLPGRVEVVVGDVTDPAVRSAAIAKADQALGGLDILVNNAGIGSFGRFADSDEARLRRIFEVNFFAVTEMIRQALPVLSRGRNPIVVNVGSILGHRALPRMHEYCATKFALRGLSESLRLEFAREGIDLLLVSPGTTETDFYDSVVHGRGHVPWPKRRGASAERVARTTLRAIERGKREIMPSFAGRWLVWASDRAPRIVDRFMSRYA